MPEFRGRKAEPHFRFNGQDVSQNLDKYLLGVKLTDVSAGSSDSLSIDLYDRDMVWLCEWYPNKGDRIDGYVAFRDWNEFGKSHTLSYGTMILDSIKFSGGPLRCTFGALSIPQDQSFKTRQRTKTWENVTVAEIASEIASRYGLSFSYDAPSVFIESVEQTDKTDSDFLSSTVKENGLKLKVYNQRIVIFDMGRLEALPPVCTIDRTDFIGDGWSYDDELEGTYTGAIIGYKSDESSKEEIKLEVGDTSRRVLYVNKKCDSYGDADTKARAAVNEANETMTKVSGAVWVKQILYSSQTVTLTGLGHARGQYYRDKVSTALSNGGTKQTLEMHKCYERL